MASSRTLRVAAIQTHASSDPDDNVARNLALAEQAVSEGATLIVFQELFRSPRAVSIGGVEKVNT